MVSVMETPASSLATGPASSHKSMATKTSTTVPAANGHVANPTPSPRRTIVYEDATFDDIPHCARIASEVFAEVAANMFPKGPNAEQVAYRTTMYDKYLDGMWAYHAGVRTRPQRTIVGRDQATGRVVAFITWVVQGGEGSDEERAFAQTDEREVPREKRHPVADEPSGFDAVVREDFVTQSAKVQSQVMGQRLRCYIKYLCVDPHVQRTGAGRTLTGLARKECPTMPLFLEAATTASAETFYLKMGFKTLGYLEFKKVVQPLPCMVLEPDTPSLLDEADDPSRAKINVDLNVRQTAAKQ